MKISITKKIENKTILEDVNLTMENCGLVFITGKSGAGKTSLLNIMAGNDVDYEGNVYITDQLEARHSAYRKNIDTVNQDFNLIGSINVYQNIVLGPKLSGEMVKEELFTETVKFLDIEHLLDRSVELLSGGEKQRVAIARALVRKNSIILADEPTGNLDTENSQKIFDIFKKLSKQCLVIVVTHDLEAAEKYGDRIITIRDGRVVQDVDRGYESNNRYVIRKKEIVKSNWRNHYVINGIIKRRKDMSGMVISMILVMFVCLAILALYSGVQKMKTTIDTELLENDKFLVSKKQYVEAEINEGFSAKEIDDLQNNASIIYALPFFQETIEVSDDKSTKSVNYQIVKRDDFFTNRYQSIEGNIPKTKTEVMLDEKMATELWSEDKNHWKIGEPLLLEYNGDEIEVTVTGVKKSYVSDENSGNIFLTTDLAEELFRIKYLQQVVITTPDGDFTSRNSMVEVAPYEEGKILQGRRPQNKQEVVVSISLVNTILKELLEKNVLYSYEDIASGKANEILDRVYIFTTDFMMKISEVTIVGISENEDGCVFYGDWYDDLPVPSNMVAVFASDISASGVENIKKIAQDNGYLAENNSGAITMIVSNQTILIAGLLAVLGIVLMVVAAVMIHSFMSVMISRRKYEMGVLSSLGNNNRDIAKMLLFEQIYTAIILCVFVDVVWSVLGSILSYDIICYNNLSIFQFKFIHLVVADCLIIFSMTIMSLPQIVHTAKTNITLALASKYN